MTQMRTPLGKVRGLGSAKDGTDHWWKQRVTAIINVPLMLWLVASVVGLAGSDYETVVTWLQHPVAATLMILVLVNIFYHLRLGLQVFIEDYIHKEGTKVLLLVTVTLLSALFCLMGIVSVLQVALRG